VDARSLKPNLIGGWSGEEVEEPRDRCDPLRKRFEPRSAKDKEFFAGVTALGEEPGGWCLCFVGLVSVYLRCKTVGGAVLDSMLPGVCIDRVE